MRWNAAVVEMDRYFKTPVLYRMGIEMFCNFVEESIQGLFYNLSMAMKLKSYNSKEFGIRNIRTIFPFLSFK
jgi:hypothetical protein